MYLTKNKVLFEIILDNLLAKMERYAISFEFQERCDSDIYLLIWVFNTPDIEKLAAVYLENKNSEVTRTFE